MGQDRKISVAIGYDKYGNVESVSKVKNITEAEYLKLFNEVSLQNSKKDSLINGLERRIAILELNLKLDRGEITQEEFDKEIKKYE